MSLSERSDQGLRVRTEALAATLSEARFGVREIDSLIYDKLSPALAGVPKEQLTWGKRGRLVVVEDAAVTS